MNHAHVGPRRSLMSHALSAWLGVLFASVLCVPTLAAADAADRLEWMRAFDDANREFAAARSNEDFLRVAARFEALRTAGAVGHAVLFDLGNAYFRAEQYGRAIAAYREAKRFAPRDAELDANLRIAYSALGISAPAPSVLDRVLFFQSWLSYREKQNAALALAGLTFLLAAGARLRFPRLVVPARIGFVLSTLALASFAVDFVRQDLTQHGVVAAKEVIARKGDAESYAPAFTQPLRMGQEFTVRERRSGFVRVELEGGLDGWLPESSVVIY